MSQSICIFGPQETGKTKFFRTYDGTLQADDSYKPTQLISMKKVEESDVTVFDFPGKESIFFPNSLLASAAAGLIIYDMAKPQLFRKTVSYIEHFKTVCSPDAPLFVLLQNNDKETEKRRAELNVQALLLHGAIVLRNKDPSEVIDIITSSLQ